MLAEPFRIIAHRGASAYAPENTMAAFELAVELGVNQVETDVHFTKDGELLLLHDHTLDRTTNGSGRPVDFTLEELKHLDAGSWMIQDENPGFRWDRDFSGESLITLGELLGFFGNSLEYHIEIKDDDPAIVSAVIDCVQQYGLVENVFFYTINRHEFLTEAKRIEAGIRTELAPNNLMREMGAFEAIAYAASLGHDMITLSSWNHSKELVQACHKHGMEARSSGIKNREQMTEAIETGCNGMTINWPDWLLDSVRERES